MNDIFKKLKYYILSLKEKNLQQKLKNSTKTSFTNKTSKKYLSKAADLTLDSETKKIIAKVRENIETIVQKTNCDPQELLGYIKATKTPIYYINNADKILNFIKEEEGLICEKEGFEALYISIFTEKKISFKTPPMFIMRDGVIDKYYLLHNFYRWYSLKSNLSGFEYRTQKNFKIFTHLENPDSFIKKLTLEEIMNLKEAITRDQEANEFVIEYTKQIEGSQKVLDKIKNEGGANI